MAFSFAISGRENLGSVNMLWGTFTQGSTDSGGDITTGMSGVMAFGAIPTNVDSFQPKYSASGGTVTLVTGNDVDGNWFAIGK